MAPQDIIYDLSRGCLALKWDMGIIRRFSTLGIGIGSLDMIDRGNPKLR
jgi:hypothetical protein